MRGVPAIPLLEQVDGSYLGDWFYDAYFVNPGSDAHWITLQLEGTTLAKGRSAPSLWSSRQAKNKIAKKRMTATRVTIGPVGRWLDVNGS